MNLQKNIKFKERYNIQLRGDSFNVFNHPELRHSQLRPSATRRPSERSPQQQLIGRHEFARSCSKVESE
jgi:hypothetical protein